MVSSLRVSFAMKRSPLIARRSLRSVFSTRNHSWSGTYSFNNLQRLCLRWYKLVDGISLKSHQSNAGCFTSQKNINEDHFLPFWEKSKTRKRKNKQNMSEIRVNGCKLASYRSILRTEIGHGLEYYEIEYIRLKFSDLCKYTIPWQKPPPYSMFEIQSILLYNKNRIH
jgi:hypothetical protein